MNLDKESKSRKNIVRVGRERGVQGTVQLSCGHVDIGRLIIHDDNQNQGFL